MLACFVQKDQNGEQYWGFIFLVLYINITPQGLDWLSLPSRWSSQRPASLRRPSTSSSTRKGDGGPAAQGWPSWTNGVLVRHPAPANQRRRGVVEAGQTGVCDASMSGGTSCTTRGVGVSRRCTRTRSWRLSSRVMRGVLVIAIAWKLSHCRNISKAP